jgi:hypothetical protein
MGGLRSSYNNADHFKTQSWKEKFEIAVAAADKLICVEVLNADQNNIVKAVYSSAVAITTADYNAFPVGSLITDLQAKKFLIHDTLTTWVASAALT